MYERIKKVRKALDLTQQEFADQIGSKRNTVATYEMGRSTPSAAVVTLICKTFDVDETWLRTGKGEMFVQRSRADELAAYMEDLLRTEPEDIRRKFALAVSHLSTEQLIHLKDIAESLVYDLQDTASTAGTDIPAPPAVLDVAGQERPEPDLAAKVAELERQNQEKDEQLQELAAEIAAIKEEDALLGLTDVSSKSPSVSVGSFSPAPKAKK